MDATPWQRYGDCTHCGWCCRIAATSLAEVTLGPTSDVAYYRVRGFTIQHQEGQPHTAVRRVFHEAVCPQWTGQAGEPGCRVYAERPPTCQDFPENPDLIRWSPCTYWFERVHPDGAVERCGGQGSPFPML